MFKFVIKINILIGQRPFFISLIKKIFLYILVKSEFLIEFLSLKSEINKLFVDNF